MQWKNTYQGVLPEDCADVTFTNFPDGKKESYPILCRGVSGDYWVTTRIYSLENHMYEWAEPRNGVKRWSIIKD